VCHCNFQLLAPTCLDNSTASVNGMFKSNGSYTAQMMIDLIEDNVQETRSSVIYLTSGWVLCLSPDCEWEPVNNNTLKESRDSHSVSLIVGLVIGVTCAIVVLLLCIIIVIWLVYKR